MPASAFDRFRALRAFMETGRKWHQARFIQDRLAAVLAVRDDPAPVTVNDMDAADAALRRGLGLFSPLRGSLARRFTAALLAARRRDVRSFLSAYHASRQRLRDAGPHRAARILEKEMQAGRVKRTAKNPEKLGNMWFLAREYEKARENLREAARGSRNGELDFRIGQSYFEEEN